MKYALLPLSAALATATLAVAESAPQFTPTAVEGVFVEQFTDGWDDRWSPSKATKEQANGEVFAYVGKWSVEEPTVYPGITGDKALVLKTKAAQHAISAPFDEVLDPKGKPLVLSYEVKLQKSLDCGGAYAKLLTESPEGIQAEEFYDKTPYTILFGPDRCGTTSKVHFIFRHKNPLTGEYEEKHLINPPQPKINRLTNLYTLIVRPEDQTYEILINNDSVRKGSLLEDFSPAVNPPTEIDDPTDSKPSDWVEQPRISDPDAVKPEDWDEDAPAMVEDEGAEMPEDWLEEEPAVVPDPEAEKPEEWSDEDDGDWIAPSVPNPKCEGVSGCGPWKRPEVPNPAYKGKWFAPLIDNPAYKGPWAPRKVPNPDYYEDKDPAAFNKIGGVGFELWSMTEDIAFDNIYIGQSESDLAQFIAETYSIKAPLEAALEAADKPESSHSHSHAHGEEPDYKKDPVGWVKFVVKRFVEEAIRDPKRAVVERPVEGGIVGVAFATVVGLLGMILSLLFSSSSSPAPSAQQVKQSALSAASAAKKKTDEAAELVQEKVLPAAQAAKESVVEKVEEVKEGVRARTTRSQTAKKEKAEESS